MTTLTITRIAHASVLIDFDEHRVLTDPWFSEKPGYYHGEPHNARGADDLDESTEKQERSQKTRWRPLEQDGQETNDGCAQRQEGSPVEESPSLDTIGEQEREPTRESVIKDWRCFDTHC